MSFALNVRSFHGVTPYGYIPTEWICILFLTLFSLSTAVHFIQAIQSRLWWLLWTVCIAGILEILGWSGRLWSSLNPPLSTPYLMQIVTTIIAPTFFVAAVFIISGQLILRLGQGYSRLSAKWYTIIFCSCDVVSLVVQAAGGAQAAGSGNQSQADTGGNIMLIGIILQLVSITFYLVFVSEFMWRYLHNRPLRSDYEMMTTYVLDKKQKRMIFALAFSSGCIYIRSIYRLIELADGWHGVVIRTQVLFNIFDAAMVTLAMVALNVMHPGRLLGPAQTWKEQPLEKSLTDDTSISRFPSTQDRV